MAWYDRTAMILAAIGAINWVFALYNANLVQLLIGSWSMTLAAIVYWIVGLSGLWVLVKAFK